MPEKKEIRVMSYREKLAVSLPLVLLLTLAYGILGPLEIFLGNQVEFAFELGNFITPLIGICVLVFLAPAFLLSLLPERAFRLATAVLLWWGVCSWLQNLLMNTVLSDVHGGPVDWGAMDKYTYFNLAVWLLLLAACLLLCKRYRAWFSFTKVTSACLCLIQGVALVSLLITFPVKPFSEPSSSLQMSGEKEFSLSAQDNIVVILFDATGTEQFDQMLAKYPDAAEIVKDFTYYDNADSHYFDTFPAATHMMTGVDVDFDQTMDDWKTAAWQSERANAFYQQLHSNGYECNYIIGTSERIFGKTENLVGKFDNVEEAEFIVDTPKLLYKLLKLSAYRYVPYILKPAFEVLTYEFQDVMYLRNAPITDNMEYYQTLCSKGLSVDESMKNSFMVTHLFGMHAPRQFDQDVNPVDEVPPAADSMRGLFVILEEYFRQLKELDKYDDSTIIVMADHASWTNRTDIQPIFFLKLPGQVQDKMSVNSAPISWDDFQATILSLAGCNNGDFGTDIFDWSPGDTRERTVYVPLYGEEHGNGLNWGKWTYTTNGDELRAHTVGEPEELKHFSY